MCRFLENLIFAWLWGSRMKIPNEMRNTWKVHRFLQVESFHLSVCLVHQRRQPGAALGQRRLPVLDCADQPGPGHRLWTALPAQQGLLPQGPNLQGDDTQQSASASHLISLSGTWSTWCLFDALPKPLYCKYLLISCFIFRGFEGVSHILQLCKQTQPCGLTVGSPPDSTLNIEATVIWASLKICCKMAAN